MFHFDHRLRPDSASDAAYVRRLAERLRLPFHLRTAGDEPARGASVEAWATVSRGNAADEVRRAIGAAVVAEGHTLDDQAETVLLNLIRGGGLEAVTGIWPGGSSHGARLGLSRCSTSNASRSRPSAGPCAFVRGTTRRTATRGTSGTRSASR